MDDMTITLLLHYKTALRAWIAAACAAGQETIFPRVLRREAAARDEQPSTLHKLLVEASLAADEIGRGMSPSVVPRGVNVVVQRGGVESVTWHADGFDVKLWRSLSGPQWLVDVAQHGTTPHDLAPGSISGPARAALAAAWQGGDLTHEALVRVARDAGLPLGDVADAAGADGGELWSVARVLGLTSGFVDASREGWEYMKHGDATWLVSPEIAKAFRDALAADEGPPHILARQWRFGQRRAERLSGPLAEEARGILDEEAGEETLDVLLDAP